MSDGMLGRRAPSLARGRGFPPPSKANASMRSSESPLPLTTKSIDSLNKSFSSDCYLGEKLTQIPHNDSGISSKTPTCSESSTSLDGSQPAILPSKMPPTRAKPARTLEVVGNMNELVVPAEAYVYRYDVEIQVVHLNGVKDLCKGPPNDYLREERRKNCYKVWRYIIQRESAFFGDPYSLYYDRASTLYSLNKLELKESSGQQFTIVKKQINESSLIKHVLPANKGECILVHIKCAEQCNLLLNDFAASIDPDVTARDRTLQQFLELATSQKIYEMDAYFNCGNKAFLKNEGRVDIGGGKWLCTGFEKNVRFVGDDEKSAVAVLQIDTKKTAFFKEILVTDFVSEHLKIRLPELQQRGLRPNETTSVSHQLRDLVVYTHKDVQFEVDGVSRESAQDIVLDVEGKKVPLPVFFEKKHGIKLMYPKLPCVVQRMQTKTGLRTSHHPMELVMIRPGQRVDLKKQTPEQVEKMIKQCAVLPKKRMEEIELHRQHAGLGSSKPNEFLANLQLKIIDKQKTAKAAVLHAPTVVYKTDKQPVDSNKGDWKMHAARKFYRPASVGIWAAMLFDERLTPSAAEKFVDLLVGRCRQRGMGINKPNYYDVANLNTDQIKQLMQSNVAKGVKYVLFISPDNKETAHDLMKLMEQQTQIVTQDVRSKTVMKALGDRGADMVLDNLSMKANMKLGGLCHSLEASADFLRLNGLQINIMTQRWLRPSRLFVGLDVCHPPPQSRQERRLQIPPKEPSVVGMCVSAGETALDLTGCFWYTMPKQEAIINDLEVYFADALKQVKEKRGLPEEIIVYRDGVSEGQYGMVITQEQLKFRKAFRAAGGEDYKPHLTIIVVQKRGSYRIMPPNPTGAKAFDQNVPPGTTVENTLVHPSHTEWIAVPHRAIQGTAKPIRCTVVVDDEPRLTMEDLEGTLYALCYAHEIVNSPTSLPAPLYGAHELAKRGRNNFRVYKNVDGSATSGIVSLTAPTSISQTLEDFDEASEALDVRKGELKQTKFWA